MDRLRLIRQAHKSTLRMTAFNLRRRAAWLLDHLTVRRLANALQAGTHFVQGSERLCSWPVALKIDLSPLCNLRCSHCIHAPAADDAILQAQHFRASQRMSVAQFRRIVEEAKLCVSSLSLHYLGDPLTHPELETLCSIARQAGLHTHISTNFSYQLSEARLRGLLTCGLSSLSVCLDGVTQETYERTRLGGSVDRVVDSLRRLTRLRRQLQRREPVIEVQYISFRHNVHELPMAERLCAEIGVDRLTEFWGTQVNMTAYDPSRLRITGPRPRRRTPMCPWPFFFMLIKYNGDVIPCCMHREGAQYAPGGDARPVGNVFEAGLRQVWNSPAYRCSRRLSVDPNRVRSEPGLAHSFCYGCRFLFDVEYIAS